MKKTVKKTEEPSEYEKQANDFLKETGTTMTSWFYNYGPHFIGEKESRDILKIELSRKTAGESKRYAFTFGQSIAKSTGTGRNKPTAYDVLSCLTKFDPGTFDDFCGYYGYDTDSQRAARVYDAVCEEYQRLSDMFTDEELEEMAEIQ